MEETPELTEEQLAELAAQQKKKTEQGKEITADQEGEGGEGDPAQETVEVRAGATLEEIASGEALQEEIPTKSYSLSEWVDLPHEQRQKIVADTLAKKPAGMPEETYTQWVANVKEAQEQQQAHEAEKAKEQSATDRYGEYVTRVMGERPASTQSENTPSQQSIFSEAVQNQQEAQHSQQTISSALSQEAQLAPVQAAPQPVQPAPSSGR